ncbi:DNA polymerase III subunit delta' [Sporosarcina sp. P13]|uniref:GlcG/HbpS family heme-binding protein n=1 Tax=Sporosarcina sp. P13 TaxID=2048263 RepID=UPI000C166A4B|nr:heme-binding protein [Sporosarcina sp. P13]PIC63226.1 DNA polymerase III subunit delta' [Sporosarcina sp. P13]
MSELTLEVAKNMIEKAEEKAKEINVPMVITIVDSGGNLIACHRMDRAFLASVDISQNKAWTAVALQMPTSLLQDVAQPGGELYGINTTNDGRIIVFGGGIPITNGDQVIGAIGVSGGSVAEDTEVAEAGIE